MNMKTRDREAQSCHAVVCAWFSLTSRERMALLLVLALIILGLAARYWYLCHEESVTVERTNTKKKIVSPPNTRKDAKW